MPASAISIPYDMGDAARLFPLCTFSDDKGAQYLLADDPAEAGLVCHELSYGLWRGTYLRSAAPSDGAVTRAEELLDCHRQNADRFPLCGEHYAMRRFRTTDGRIVRRLRARGINARLRPAARMIPDLLHIIMQGLLAALMLFLAMKTPLLGAMLKPLSALPGEKRARVFVMLCACMTVLLYFLRSEDRTLFDLIVNSALPPGLFLQANLIQRSRLLLAATLITLGALILFITVPCLIRAIRTRNSRKRADNLRRAISELGWPLMIMVIVSFYITVCFHIPLVSYAEPIDEEAEAILDERYTAELENLREDVFAGLSPEVRLETLRVIADYECRHTLGCTTPDITAGDTPENCSGYYADAIRAVTINKAHLAEDSSADVLDTVLHEIRHAYQHQVIAAYTGIADRLDETDRKLDFFRYAASLADNSAAYHEVENEGYAAYYEQAMEEDSRSWASDRFYREYILWVYPRYYAEETDETALTDGEATTDTAAGAAVPA